MMRNKLYSKLQKRGKILYLNQVKQKLEYRLLVSVLYFTRPWVWSVYSMRIVKLCYRDDFMLFWGLKNVPAVPSVMTLCINQKYKLNRSERFLGRGKKRQVNRASEVVKLNMCWERLSWKFLGHFVFYILIYIFLKDSFHFRILVWSQFTYFAVRYLPG